MSANTSRSVGAGALFWALVVSASLVFVVRSVHAEQTQFFGVLFDDAYISLRHALNFWLGHGFNFNPGERVEGYTNFLYTALMSGAFFLDLPPELWIKCIGVASGVAVVVGTGVLARPLVGPAAGGLLALGLALAEGLPLFAASGMETILFAALLTWGFALVFRAWWVTASVAFALAAMARMEAVLVYGVAGLYVLVFALRGAVGPGRLRDGLRAPLAFALPFGVLFGGFYATRWSYYGHPFPNTYYAKVGSVSNSYERGLEHLQLMTSHMGLRAALGIAALAVAVWLLALCWRRRAAARENVGVGDALWPAQVAALLGACGLYLAYTIRVGGDSHVTFGDRFLVHVLPLLAVGLVGSLAGALSSVRLAVGGPRPSPVDTESRWLRAVATAAAACLALTLALSRCPALDRSFEGASGWASLGVYLRQTAEAGDVVATTAAGAIPYFSRLQAIDMYGLADPNIAHKEKPGLGRGLAAHEKMDMAYVLGRKPRYIANWLPRRGPVRIEGYRLAGLVRMDGSVIDPARVLQLDAQPTRQELTRLRDGRGAVPGRYSFALFERVSD